MNHILVAGYLGADPEVRYTPSGQKVATLRIASTTRRNGKNGKEEITTWWKATLWGDQYDKMLPYLKKGTALMVMGEMSKPEIFTDREGKPQVSLNITVSQVSFSPFGRPDSKGDEQKEGASPFAESGAYASGAMHGQKGAVDFNEDEIPF